MTPARRRRRCAHWRALAAMRRARLTQLLLLPPSVDARLPAFAFSLLMAPCAAAVLLPPPARRPRAVPPHCERVKPKHDDVNALRRARSPRKRLAKRRNVSGALRRRQFPRTLLAAPHPCGRAPPRCHLRRDAAGTSQMIAHSCRCASASRHAPRGGSALARGRALQRVRRALRCIPGRRAVAAWQRARRRR